MPMFRIHLISIRCTGTKNSRVTEPGSEEIVPKSSGAQAKCHRVGPVDGVELTHLVSPEDIEEELQGQM